MAQQQAQQAQQAAAVQQAAAAQQQQQQAAQQQAAAQQQVGFYEFAIDIVSSNIIFPNLQAVGSWGDHSFAQNS